MSKRILLKLTGEIFLDQETKTLTNVQINRVVEQIKQLVPEYQFGIVVGGGNFFRGNDQGKQLGISAPGAHQIGMVATMMNGLILKDIFEQHGMVASHFCAVPCPEIGKPISHQAIISALQSNRTLIFSGGTGNPFFTTDTTAIVRGLQIGAAQVWKGTDVPGIYTADPRTHPEAELLKRTTFSYAMQKHLGVMDLTAYALAAEHHQTVRIFDIFSDKAIIQAAHDETFGSLITT